MDTLAVNFERLVNRRASELDGATRMEILSSVGAALFCVAFISWQFASIQGTVSQLGLAFVVLGAAATVYRFRQQIWPKPVPPGTLAATGLAYYRAVLERRRAHLKDAWTWHGPLVLACLILFATLFQVAFPSFERLRNILPFSALLLLWIFLGVRFRTLKAAEIQRELNELEDTHPTGNFT